MGNGESVEQQQPPNKYNVQLNSQQYKEYVNYMRQKKIQQQHAIQQQQQKIQLNKQQAAAFQHRQRQFNPIIGENTSNRVQQRGHQQQYMVPPQRQYDNAVSGGYIPRMQMESTFSDPNLNTKMTNLNNIRGVPPQQRHPQQRHPQQRHPQQRHPQQRHPQQRQQPLKSSEKSVEELSLKECDPFNLLKSNKNMSLEELKMKYKKLALIHHPDKGGDRENFELLIKAYRNIDRLIDYKTNNKTHGELKRNYQSIIEDQKKTQNVRLRDTGKKLNLEKFNNVYLETRLYNPNDEGYGDMMSESSKKRDDIEIDNTVGKFTKSNFHQKFREVKNQHQSSAVIEYKPPEAVVSNKNLQYSELGEGKIGNYSDQNVNGNSFTDYKQAHSNTYLIDPSRIKVKHYKSVDDLKTDRKNVGTLTEDQLYAIEEAEERKKIDEWNRRERLKQNDQRIKQHFDHTNQLMLQ